MCPARACCLRGVFVWIGAKGVKGVGGVPDMAGLRQRGSGGGLAEELLFQENALLVEPADQTR